MLILLLLLMGVDAPCPDDTGVSGLRAPMADLTAPPTAAQHQAFQDHIRCLDELAGPQVAKFVHAVVAQGAMLEGDVVLADQAAVAFHDVVGQVQTPAHITQPAKVDLRLGPWVELQVPKGTALFVDGVPATSRPSDRPALYQAMGSGGVILWTHYLRGDEDLPPGFERVPAEVDVPQSGLMDVEGLSHDELMELLRGLLAEGRWEDAVTVSVPAAGAAANDEQARELRAIAELALDQLRRLAVRHELDGQLPDSNPRNRPGMKLRTRDPRKGALFGVDLGAPSGLRFEWKFAGKVVDGIGLRAGANMATDFNTTVLFGPDLLAYVDFRLAESWQIELGVGMMMPSYYFVPQIGGALQFDPPSPLQVQVGLRTSFNSYVVPDVGISLLW